MSTRRPWSALGGDAAQLRRVFMLVPWRMRWRTIGLLVAAAVSALLDILAVASMLPLTQLLAAPDALPGVVSTYLVPLIGTDDRRTVLLVLALLVVTAFVVKNLTVIAIRWWSLGITNAASSAAQSEMLRWYMAAPYAAHRRRSRGRIMQVLSGAVPAAFNGVLLGYITVVVYGFTVILLAVTLLVAAPLASLAAIIIFGGASLLLSQVLRPRSLRNGQGILGLETESWRILNPAIDGFRDARLFLREAHFTDRYETNRHGVAGLSRWRALYSELPKYLLEIVMVLGIFCVAVILFATNDDATAFGLLAMFAAASVRMIPSLNLVVATYNGIVSNRPSLAMVTEEMDELEDDRRREQAPSDEDDGLDVPDGAWNGLADIVVDGLGFRYPDGDEDVLRDVSVRIPAGRTIALVGGSGAGKTTFADILAGLLPPTRGSVTVEGVDISRHARAWLAQVAMVSQKIYLWDDTLRSLITFGEAPEEVDAELLDDVVRRAHLQEFVDALPEGLDTRIGESGARLSGGQAQRVGIARALYASPQVLILDEATSALDNETEHRITATIEDLHGEITVIVIAHRLSTVKNADEILFFADGTLRARGTMAQLRDEVPEFARLVQLGTLIEG
ncbi:ABC transporter ATP-binding protein/permease [Brachybacterium halotolerans subsp. kimchii]|uniref:ABC transporter ATP-binding protein n=1 Tax=Brachybacterium halotolerans TaxID=2795215 RepID=UPI001E3CFB3A|nr:ABC transporter ATP-binding protein [Brachybacterium halotolerans]UEJ81121.1 ABC transporter ATP-binding protein/permease [Brachybacterium halotolerans subsp. kimchii]